MRSALLTFLVATMAAAQYRGLAAPGDGGTLYFSEDQPLKGSTAPAQGPIYSVGGRGFALISERPAPVLPDVTPFPREYYTDYYALLRFDQSRDGTISALTGQRDCFGSSLCGVVRRYSTSVQMPGRATFPVAGAGRLSGNGRYLLTDECYPGAHPVLTDLATGEQWPTDLPSTGISTGSRVVADDGAVAYVLGPRILVRKRGTSSQHQLPFRGAEAAIVSRQSRNVLLPAK